MKSLKLDSNKEFQLEIRNRMSALGGKFVMKGRRHLCEASVCVIAVQDKIEIALNFKSKWFYVYSHDKSSAKCDIPQKLVNLESGLREIDGLRIERVERHKSLLDNKENSEYGVVCKYHLPKDFDFKHMTDVQWRRLFGWYFQIEVELLHQGVYTQK